MADKDNILDTPASGGGGAMEQIVTFDESAVSSINLTDIGQSYNSLLLIVDAIMVGTNNAEIYMRVSINNGSSYLAGIYDNIMQGIQITGTARNRFGANQTAILLNAIAVPNMTTVPPSHIAMRFINYNDAVGDGWNKFEYQLGTGINVDQLTIHNTGSSMADTGGAINAFQLLASTGTITAKGALYGIT